MTAFVGGYRRDREEHKAACRSICSANSFLETLLHLPGPPSSDQANDLVAFIKAGIAAKGNRNVFDSCLDEVFPLQGKDRTLEMEQIRRFAVANGWQVRFAQAGRMARFRPAAPSKKAAG